MKKIEKIQKILYEKIESDAANGTLNLDDVRVWKDLEKQRTETMQTEAEIRWKDDEQTIKHNEFVEEITLKESIRDLDKDKHIFEKDKFAYQKSKDEEEAKRNEMAAKFDKLKFYVGKGTDTSLEITRIIMQICCIAAGFDFEKTGSISSTFFRMILNSVMKDKH